MSIPSFEGWIIKMIAEDIAIQIEDAIINGDGSGDPCGVAYAATYSTTDGNLVEVTGTAIITYANILKVIAALPARYGSNAKFLCDRAMIYQGLANVVDKNGKPILINDATSGFQNKVLGYPVIESDKAPAKTLFFGDYTNIVGNLAQDITVEKDMSAGFASNSIAYRGAAIFDCDVALSDAFVKLTTAVYDGE
jgi:HK97 family phage major capsid protein